MQRRTFAALGSSSIRFDSSVGWVSTPADEGDHLDLITGFQHVDLVVRAADHLEVDLHCDPFPLHPEVGEKLGYGAAFRDLPRFTIDCQQHVFSSSLDPEALTRAFARSCPGAQNGLVDRVKPFGAQEVARTPRTRHSLLPETLALPDRNDYQGGGFHDFTAVPTEDPQPWGERR